MRLNTNHFARGIMTFQSFPHPSEQYRTSLQGTTPRLDFQQQGDGICR